MTWCPLPWMHIATRPNGDVRLCATANASGSGEDENKEAGLVTHDGIKMNLRHHTMEEVWNSSYMKDVRVKMMNGEKPQSCMKCYNEEAQGIPSKREWETIEWNKRIDLSTLIPNTQPDGTAPLNINYFDLRLGNLCQLKCVMCSPHDSSSWIKDWKIQYPQYKIFELKNDQHWDRKMDYTWYQKGSFLDTMRNQAHNIKEMYFAGGEPLLIPEHYKILEFMIESGNSSNCILRYNSNGLELSEKIFELWNHFKEVRFNISIDSVAERNEYIRYPSKWNDMLNSLQRLDDTPDNIIVNIACAVQLLNITTMHELAHWKLSQNYKKIHMSEGSGGVTGMHLVCYPSYLNMRVLPKEFKDVAVKNLTQFLDSYNNTQFDNDIYGRKRWLGMINYIQSEDWSHKLPQAIEYLEVTDKTRGTNFRETFTELRNL